MRFKILRTLIAGSLSFIMATSAIDSYGALSNAYTDSKLEVNNIETETETPTETIVKEKGIDDVPTQETTEESIEKITVETSEVSETVDKVEEETKTIKVSTANEQPIEQPIEQTEQNGNKVSLGTYKLTAYCACSKCCGKWAGGNTSSGTVPTQGRTVACNTLAAGTKVNINGHDYIVEDTGNMKGNVIDIFFNNHQEALNFGVQYVEVFVYNN